MAKANQFLATSQLEEFLVEAANLQNDLGAIQRFQKRFPRFIINIDQSQLDMAAAAFGDAGSHLSQIGELGLTHRDIGNAGWTLLLTKMLRNLWIEPDPRQKEWSAFCIRYYVYNKQRSIFGIGIGEETLLVPIEVRLSNDTYIAVRFDFPDDNLLQRGLNPKRSLSVPDRTPFDDALGHLIKSAHRAQFCANQECPAPYFFAKRKNQRYCSEVCAAPAHRKMKLKWWTENGAEWRTARRGSKPSKPQSDKRKSRVNPKQAVKKRKKGK